MTLAAFVHICRAFARRAGVPALSGAEREQLVRFYTRQLAITDAAVGAGAGTSDDPFSRKGLRFRIKPRAHLRRKYKPVFV